MASTRPPELERLLEAEDPASADEAWEAFLRTFSSLLLFVARSTSDDYDGSMNRYRFILEELRKDECSRLRAYDVDPRCRFSTWLVVVARRLCVDYHRSRYGRKRPMGREAEESKAARRLLADMIVEELDPGRAEDTTTSNPEKNLRREEISTALREAIGGLEPDARLLLSLRFQDGLPASKIARTMRFPTVFHVYRGLNRVLGTLRSELEKRGVHDPVP